ncbi:MAG TPA: response regulator [Enhygromyxa sp.]|nr:response regulator [Enhygromyxa sp.]
MLLCEVVRSLAHGECLAVRSLEDLVACQDEALSCDLVLLDVNLGVGASTGLDALEWLRAHDFKGRIVFLTGHARTHPLVERARSTAGVPVLEKPITIDTLLSLLSAPAGE